MLLTHIADVRKEFSDLTLTEGETVL